MNVYKIVFACAVAVQLASCGEMFSKPATDSNVTIEPVDGMDPVTDIAPEIKFQHKFPDLTLTGVSEGLPTVRKSPVLGLKTDTSYKVKFTLIGDELAAGSTFRVDLYPDTLPEQTFPVTTDKVEHEWTVSSDKAEISGATMRFFLHMPVGAQINVTDIVLDEL